MQQELAILIAYFLILSCLVRVFHKKVRSETDFILGNRSLNFWLTALSAHASDMSAWLFLGYPALVFSQGVFSFWAAIGLIIGMFLNWQFVAPALRQWTERLGTLTLSAYFEMRYQEKSGSLRLTSSLLSIFFFTCYIASGIAAIGVLGESLLGISYTTGITAGLGYVVLYVLWGGYRTVAWIDLFQGFFLLGVILFIPLSLLSRIGGIDPLFSAISLQQLSTSLVPQWDIQTGWQILLIALGWGLGYFGQPHILTKFMGIKEEKEIPKAKYLGMSWQCLTLGAATLVGLLCIFFFPEGVTDSQQVTLNLVKMTFPSWIAGLVLCAIVAATTNVMAAHLLIVASNLSEDLYKPLINPQAPSQTLLTVSRWGVIGVSCIAYLIAHLKLSSVYHIVLYAWSGLGASFGPLVLFSLYSSRLHPKTALYGLATGGIVAALWPSIDLWQIPPIIPAFLLSSLVLALPIPMRAQVPK